MTKKINRKYFNMVEVAMALAIIAIAVVSLMGLLPVAMKSSKNSVAENSISNIASLMKVEIDAKYNNNDFNDFLDGKIYPLNTDDLQCDEEDTVDFSDKDDYGYLAPTDTNFKDSKKIYNKDELKSRGYQIYQGGDDKILGMYLFELYSGEFDDTKEIFENTEFSGVVRIWVQPLDGEINIPYTASPASNVLEGDVLTNAKQGCTVFMRISWPADASYQYQEHKVFSFDYFKKD